MRTKKSPPQSVWIKKNPSFERVVHEKCGLRVTFQQVAGSNRILFIGLNAFLKPVTLNHLDGLGEETIFIELCFGV
jgi:hypothetical protein